MRDILIFDIETDGLDVDTAQMKWFGAYSYKTDKYYLLDYNKIDEIKNLIKSHKILIGFNNKNFDQPILENNLEIDFTYKVIIDLYEISAPRSGKEYGKYNKNKLVQMGFKLKKYTLDNISSLLKLDNESKGKIDYKIFQKDNWSEEEVIEIEKYLKQDIILTKKLFEWYEEQFAPLKTFLSKEEVNKLYHIKSSLASLAYRIICNKANLPIEWDDRPITREKSFSGGHHIENRWNKVKGNIIEIDFTSAYPHALMMGNLYSPQENGWEGNNYYKIDGTYNKDSPGKIESALKEVFLERLKAKKNKETAKDKSYKIIINSLYGLTGNPKFKSIYNKTTASDCTSIVRTWMKKLAKELEENDFVCLYGFTDSIFVKIPEQSNKEELMFLVNKCLDKFKINLPFPMETFRMDIEEELKFIWFVAKNCYLFVTKDNEVKYKSTLLNQNTPKVILKLFEEYIKPNIIESLDVKFTLSELKKEIDKILLNNPQLAEEEYKVDELNNYKVKTSIHYQVSKRYGSGRHFLIPNIRNIGVGKSKTTKNKVGVRYCTYEEFVNKGLSINDIDKNQLIKHVKVFITKPEQRTLEEVVEK